MQSPHLGVVGSPNGADDGGVHGRGDFYRIRIQGHLGVTALSAFPAMVHRLDGQDTVLSGWLEDRSAVFGVLAQIEALGLELDEFRKVRAPPSSGREPGEYRPGLP